MSEANPEEPVSPPASPPAKRLRKIKNAFTPAQGFIPVDEVPFDVNLRKQSRLERLYEKVRPIRYIVKLDYRYDREYMYDFMPVSHDSFAGRGSYKNVYRLPWDKVVKMAKNILPSDPYYGSQYQAISRSPEHFMRPTEIKLMEYLERRHLLKKGKRELRRKFYRLALERLHYETIRKLVPDLVVPTEYFMGVRFRQQWLSKKTVPLIMPCDVQPVLHGKHLKEFAHGAIREKQSAVWDYFSPRWQIIFDSRRFGKIKKKVLVLLKEDLKRIVQLCRYLATNEKLILDLHAENLIITLPNFQIRLFDFHLFDPHLYEPEVRGENPEKEHIEMIENFIESLHWPS